MHPTLLQLGPLRITGYGAALATAFLVGISLAARRAERRGLDADAVRAAAMVILVSSIVGSRLFYVLTHIERFRPPHGSWVDVFNPFQAGSVGITGLSMSGGVFLAVVSTLLFFRLRRLPVLPYVDAIAPSVPLGEGITRIGCFLNGCCFGTPSHLPWAVHFPPGSPAVAVYGDAAVHPAQLYSSLAGFASFAVLIWIAGSARRDGTVFFAFLALWGVTRMLLDLVRHYGKSAILAHLGGIGVTMSQGFALSLAVAGLLGIVLMGRASAGRAVPARASNLPPPRRERRGQRSTGRRRG
jgi:phosphatidylglycerol:prolipoprotein diacylglycerol transferase